MSQGNVQEAYDKGWNAFDDGYEISDNPYRDNRTMNRAWSSGWRKADEAARGARRAT